MYRSIYSLNMDTELRRDMDEVCKEMGMSLNTALILFMKKVVRDRKIPFEIRQTRVKSLMPYDGKFLPFSACRH